MGRDLANMGGDGGQIRGEIWQKRGEIGQKWSRVMRIRENGEGEIILQKYFRVD